MGVHPLQASSQFAEDAFAFLRPLGFTLQERRVTGGDSFKDGWLLSFVGPKIEFIVQYMDMQFEVHFVRADLTVSYREIDRDLFDRRSGFHGDMFPPQKLEAAISRIAADIDAHYRSILAGDEVQWTRLVRLKAKPREAPRLPGSRRPTRRCS